MLYNVIGINLLNVRKWEKVANECYNAHSRKFVQKEKE